MLWELVQIGVLGGDQNNYLHALRAGFMRGAGFFSEGFLIWNPDFQNNGLSVTINMNMTQAKFLDVSMNIESGKYKPYRKPNNIPLYINKSSNHPPTIINQIPSMIQTR